MPSVFKVTVVQYWVKNAWIGLDGKPCPEGTPGARFVKARKVPKGTPGAKKVKKKSGKWYGRPQSGAKPVPLSTNKVAAQQQLADLVKKAELGRAGIADPFEEHRKQPLAEHLADYRLELQGRGNEPEYVRLVSFRLDALLTGCGFKFMADLSASRVLTWPADLRAKGAPRAPLPAGKDLFTLTETAALLGVTVPSLSDAVRRHRLKLVEEVIDKRKRRMLPRAAVEALQDRRAQGASVQTTNYYLSHLKSFCRWLVKDRRMDDSTRTSTPCGTPT
jgi:hypothetical protein